MKIMERKEETNWKRMEKLGLLRKAVLEYYSYLQHRAALYSGHNFIWQLSIVTSQRLS